MADKYQSLSKFFLVFGIVISLGLLAWFFLSGQTEEMIFEIVAAVCLNTLFSAAGLGWFFARIGKNKQSFQGQGYLEEKYLFKQALVKDLITLSLVLLLVGLPMLIYGVLRLSLIPLAVGLWLVFWGMAMGIVSLR